MLFRDFKKIINSLKNHTFLKKLKETICYRNNNKKFRGVNYSYISKNNNGSFKKVCIFACYFKDGKIKDYVIYYIKQLFLYFDKIIIISDSQILKGEENKIKKYGHYIQLKRHSKYDFGSYAIGLRYLKEIGKLKTIELLCMCNDSVVGPIFKINNALKKFINGNYDYFGMVKSMEINEHLQGWFLCFKTNVFNDKRFLDFFFNVRAEISETYVIENYELKLDLFLQQCGYRCTYLVPPLIVDGVFFNPMFKPLDMIKTYNCPFIKIKFLRGLFPLYCGNSIDELLDFLKNANIQIYHLIKNII